MSTDSRPTPAEPSAHRTASYVRLPLREDRLFLMLAIIIGVLSGLAVVCFRFAIEWCRITFLGGGTPTYPRLFLAPILTGFVIAALVMLVFPAVRGSGVNQTKAALYIYNGYIPFRTAVGKFITSALAIGSGQSLGPEDPSLQIGATLASALGRNLRLSRDNVRLIAPVGAAAGLAAAFNAPISAVLFVIEEVIGRWSAGILGAVVLAAVSSVMVTRAFLGAAPLFSIPAVAFISAPELLAYALLGVFGGVASIVFAKAIGTLRPRLKAAPRWTQYFQPAAAGLIIGLIGYAGFPQVMGAGYDAIEQAMHGRFTWQVLGALAGLKILSTTVSFVSGTPGGMFAPTLFIGAMLGGAVGGVERLLYPQLTGTAATYALVGMGVLFAGFLRAPMTSVFMVLEVSGNYSIIVPVMVANTFAYLISRAVVKVPIFDMLSQQDGLELPSMEEQRELRVVRIEDAMRPPDVPIIAGDERLRDAYARVTSSHPDNVLVHLGAGRWGATTPSALQQLIDDGKDDVSVADLFRDIELPHFYPDHPLHFALSYLHDWPVLPVVHRANPQKLEGVLELADALRAYRAGLSHR